MLARKLYGSSGSPADRAKVTETFSLCSVPNNKPQPTADDLGYWVQAQFDSAAMGSYPFETYYIAGTPNHPAPPYPVRVMCDRMMKSPLPKPDDEIGVMRRLAWAVAVIANVTEDVVCNDISDLGKSVTSPTWDYMVCSERMINEIPYFGASGTPNDMFWRQTTWNQSMFDDYCSKAWGVKPRYYHWQALGPKSDARGLAAVSNVVFTNGQLDPWSSGGILSNESLAAGSVAYFIHNAGHHLDLFFPTQQDTVFAPDVIWVRERQLESVKKWIAEYNEQKLQQQRSRRHRSMLFDF
jgi:lysosomal Pro-X carboxypeptidase